MSFRKVYSITICFWRINIGKLSLPGYLILFLAFTKDLSQNINILRILKRYFPNSKGSFCRQLNYIYPIQVTMALIASRCTEKLRYSLIKDTIKITNSNKTLRVSSKTTTQHVDINFKDATGVP